MNPRGGLSGFRQFLKNVLWIELALLIANLFITWLLRWSTLSGYGQGLIFAGLSAIVVGLFSLTDGAHVSTGFYGFGQMMMPSTFYARIRQGLPTVNESFASLWPLSVAGLIAIAFGTLIEILVPWTITMAR